MWRNMEGCLWYHLLLIVDVLSGPRSTLPLLAILSFASWFDQKTAFVSFPEQ